MMIYEVWWRDAGSDDPYEPMPSRHISTDGETFYDAPVLMTLLHNEQKEFRLFSTQVDDRNWVPVS